MKVFLNLVNISLLLTTIFIISIIGCTSKTESNIEKIRLSYSKPYFGDSYVTVIYKEKISNDKNDSLGRIILYGLEYAADYAKTSDELGVGIKFADGSGSYYYVNNFYMIQFKEKDITWEEFRTFIKTKDFPLK